MNKVAMTASITVFVLGTLLLFRYKQTLESDISGGNRVPVLAVASLVEMGSLLGESDLSVQEIPEAYVEDRHILVSDSEKVLGVRAASQLTPGQSLLWSDLHVARNGRHLSGVIQPGKRAITITGEADTLHNLIRSGDRVDLLLTTTRDGGIVSFPLLQNLLVLAVGADVGDKLITPSNNQDTEVVGRQSTTLSVSPTEAQLVAVAKNKGTLTPILRNPSDLEMLEKPVETSLLDVLQTERRAAVQGTRYSSNRGVAIERVK